MKILGMQTVLSALQLNGLGEQNPCTRRKRIPLMGWRINKTVSVTDACFSKSSVVLLVRIHPIYI